MARAIYPGSFDMFTNGHLDIVEQAVKIFDKVIIVVQNNPTKKRTYTIESCNNFIAFALKDKNYIDKISVDISDIPASLYAKEHGCEFIIRGLRNTSDYLYEEKIAEFYKSICPSIDIVYFKSKYDKISSSLVKGLLHYGVDADYAAEYYLPMDVSVLERCDDK